MEVERGRTPQPAKLWAGISELCRIGLRVELQAALMLSKGKRRRTVGEIEKSSVEGQLRVLESVGQVEKIGTSVFRGRSYGIAGTLEKLDCPREAHRISGACDLSWRAL